MGHVLTDYGEEYFISNGLDSGGTAWTVGLYDDASVGSSGDSISDTSDLGAISTEPDDTLTYDRQTTTFSPSDEDGDATGLQEASVSDNSLTFDLSDSGHSGTVDSWFLVINFAATGDGGTATDHLVATGALEQEYSDIADVDTLEISAGGVGVSVN